MEELERGVTISNQNKKFAVGVIGHVDSGKATLTAALMSAVNNKVDVIVIDEPKYDNSFVVNGERYAPIEREEKKHSKGLGKLATIAAMTYLPYISNLGSPHSKYDRKLPKGVDLVKEFSLIQNKQSKLSKWERDEVIFQFNKHFKKV